MAKLAITQVDWQFAQAKKKRQPLESRFNDAFKYSMPFRRNWYEEANPDSTSSGYDPADIFDDTAVVAVQEFSSRLQAGITPNYSRWAILAPGFDVPAEEKDEVSAALDPVTEIVFDVLQSSNFSTESSEALLDLAVSVGAYEANEGDALNPINFDAIPMSTLWIDEGPFGGLDKFFRQKSYTFDQFTVKYPNHTLPADLAKDLKESGKAHTFIEATIRDWSEPSTERHWKYVYELKDKAECYSEEYVGIGSCPIIAFRWGKAAGEVWGRGPLLNCMPSVKTLNLVKQMILENAQLAISGVYQADDDGTVNVDTIELIPGTIIPRAPNTNGLQRIDTGADFNVADLIIADMQATIKRALYNDMLGNPNKTPMSATEVAERMSDLSRQVGSAFGRLQIEYVAKTIQRVIFILKKRKLIELPAVNGRTIKVRSTSPLAQAQNFEDISNVDRLATFVGTKFGPQLANVFLKGEEISAYVGDKLQVPSKLMRNKAEMKQIINAVKSMAESGQVPDPNAPAEEQAVA